MALAEHLQRAAAIDPDHLAMIFGPSRWSYGQLDALTSSLAAGFQAMGVGPGDRVALQLGNRPELVFAYYACLKLGAICVPINNRFAGPEIEFAINHSACRLVISQSDLYESLASIRNRLVHTEKFFLVDDPGSHADVLPFAPLLCHSTADFHLPVISDDHVAAILYTSGTTSRPKGVTHTHGSLQQTVENHGRFIDLRADDIFCLIPPMCHILGFACQLLPAVWARASFALVEKFNADSVLRMIEDLSATRIAVLPVMLQAMINHPQASAFSLRSLRTCIAGGDAVPVALQQSFFERFGVQVLEGCGMTEVIPFTLNTATAYRQGSIGKSCPGMSIRLIDDNGNEVPSGSVGEILVRSQAAMIGYWQEPEISAQTLDGGFVHTGDLGRIDQDGFYWFTGRKKEIIIRGGSNISPLEVEEALYAHSAVRECGVVGVPDAQFGEVIWAYVALLESCSVSSESLLEFLRTRIAAYKIPESVQFMDELPKGATGKIHRPTLRKMAISARSARG